MDVAALTPRPTDGSLAPLHSRVEPLARLPVGPLLDLRDRAAEARKPRGCLFDPDAVWLWGRVEPEVDLALSDAVDPMPAVRSKLFDRELLRFLRRHPDAQIVSLGEGLETQRFRICAPRATWVTVDVPALLELRERCIRPDRQHRHMARSIFDRAWLRAVPGHRPTFVSAQGLTSTFDTALVRRLATDLVDHFERAVILLDILPPPERDERDEPTTEGPASWSRAPSHLPPREAGSTLRSWLADRCRVDLRPWVEHPRGWRRWRSELCASLPGLAHALPQLARITVRR
jgi:O-methyltransferase involved in polyketide biosynthesis